MFATESCTPGTEYLTRHNLTGKIEASSRLTRYLHASSSKCDDPEQIIEKPKGMAVSASFCAASHIPILISGMVAIRCAKGVLQNGIKY